MKFKNPNIPFSLTLEASGLLFNTIFNQQFQFMAILNAEGVVIEVNDTALESQGVNRNDYVGKLFWETTTWKNLPESESIWKQRLTEAATKKTTILNDDAFQVKDGAIYYPRSSTIAIFKPESDHVYGFIIQAVDTTKRRLVEKKIRENDARLSFVLDHSHIGNWDLDLINNTSVRSLKHDQIFGYDSKLPEWNYDLFLSHVIPEDKEAVDKKYQYAINHKIDWIFECRIRRTDGEIRWILVSGGFAYAETGEVNLMCGIVQDVTILKELELNDIRHHDELKSLFKALPDTYFRMKSDGTILDCITQNPILLYKPPQSFIGKRMQDVLGGSVGELFQLKIDKINKLQTPLAFNYELIINNQLAHFDARLNKIAINDQLICVVRDISEQVYLSNILEQSQAVAKLGSWVQTVNVEAIFWTNEVYSIFEYDKKETITFELFFERIHPDDRDDLFKCLNFSIEKHTPFQSEYRLLLPDGRLKYVLDNAEHIYDDNNQHIQSIGTIQDITQQKDNSEKHQISFKVFNDTHEGILITNAQQIIVEVNPRFTDITGYSHEEIIGQHLNILNSGKQSEEFYEQIWQSIAACGFWQGELWNRTKQGELYAELLNISSVKNDFDEVTHFVGVFSDITQGKKQLEKLNQMAHYDELTKLPNRALFVDRFQQSIAHSERTGHQLAVCFLDLDNFKPINDNHGHEAGDLLLVEVANRIKTCIRNEDTVSRQGGDEFAILLNDIKSTSQYEKMMCRIHKILSLPYFIDDVELHITASSGVTLYPSDTGDIDTLLRHADHAMYQSKLNGKNCFHLYSPASDQRIIQKNLLVDEVKQALENNELELYFQPKVNMATGEVFGAEALIRWNHPQKGIIPPLDFLPLIDNTPLDIEVGEWVIKNSLQQIDEWLKQGLTLELSINISSNHLLSSSFVKELEKSLAQYPLHYSQYLQLEILESSVFGDIQTLTHIIESCQNKLGVAFSLDDFGTGYSSLTHLRRLPVNTIKIDRSFVRDILDDPSDFAIIEGVIALTRSFSRHVIAEGVETTNHGLMLLLMGCESAQGYQIAKPMPNDAFITWLSDYTPNEKWLSLKSKNLNKKQNHLAVFKLICLHTFEKIRQLTLSSTDDSQWPILGDQANHCKNWICRQKKERMFKADDIDNLEAMYNKADGIIQLIRGKFQDGDVDGARILLPDLDSASCAITAAIID
ncbi:EAL domain-containing protein [Colwellia sp. MSW7]|uniref:EAL domain-containing protein n=1 Tax=Colwellia maritima TaxID=2912588 RepID=A0ABS9X3I4_9GAMM|nr:bifunctional diguanylate cyclase/phosphodiesterase [Colwellia maritima]MCI2284785.1 EAL domain-containing protein [Colwellia maritima]